MSRVGKQIIVIPEKTDVTVHAGVLCVKGPLGELSRKTRDEVLIEVKGTEARVIPAKKTALTKALWGTYASHLKNMVLGVNTPFQKKLVVEGIGYRVNAEGGMLTLQVGFSHPVEIRVPEELNVEVQKNVITVTGINKEAVGKFAAYIRSVKKPEPYKGKGIRYENEVIRRKQGKKAA